MKPILFDNVDPVTMIRAMILMLVVTQCYQALRKGYRRIQSRPSAGGGEELPQREDGGAYDLRANDAAAAAEDGGPHA